MIEYMKGGSLIASSGCDNFSLLRSPMDVAMKCVSDNGYLLLKRSLQRIKRTIMNATIKSRHVAAIIACSRHSLSFDVVKVSYDKRKVPESDNISKKTVKNRNKKMRRR